jgi:hypothetical protein
VSQGIAWQSNHPDPPASNGITTGPGAARTGLWGIFDPDHGYATGTPTECDVDVPPLHCLYHDGFTGVREPGNGPLHGIGGYVHGTFGANVAIALDGGVPFGGGHLGLGYEFFGVIDADPAGFGRFEVRELDGKVGQALFIFGDDFSLLTSPPTSVEAATGPESGVILAAARPNPSDGNTGFRFFLPAAAGAELSIHDAAGRLVRRLAADGHAAGWHAVTWDGRNRAGHRVAAGVYFGRLVVHGGAGTDVRMRKLVITR